VRVRPCTEAAARTVTRYVASAVLTSRIEGRDCNEGARQRYLGRNHDSAFPTRQAPSQAEALRHLTDVSGKRVDDYLIREEWWLVVSPGEKGSTVDQLNNPLRPPYLYMG